MANIIDNRIPSRLVIVAGTYDGVLAGWDTVEHSRPSDENDIELKYEDRATVGAPMRCWTNPLFRDVSDLDHNKNPI